MNIKQLPSQDTLKKLFKYDPINGYLVNKTNRNHKKAGERSGTHDSKGYRRVFVNGQHYAEHRVIWVLAYGYIPRDKLIDHINRNRTDNRLDNLRLVSPSENNLNTSAIAMSRTGHRGVYQTRAGKYQAQIRRNGKKLHLGTFDTVDAASLAYQRASSKAKRVGKRYNPYRFSRPITAYEPCMFTGRIECLDKLASHMYAELFGDKKASARLIQLWILLRDLTISYWQHPEQYLGVELNSNAFGKGGWLRKIGFSYRPFYALIEHLALNGFIEFKKGFQDRKSNVGMCSRIKATDLLIAKFDEFDLARNSELVYPVGIPDDLIVIKDHSKASMEIPVDDLKVNLIIKQLRDYNSALHEADIDLTFKDFVPDSSDPIIIDLNKKYVHRVFGKSSIDFGGRLYGGWWSNCSKELRSRILIDKHPTIEIDVKALYPALLYACEGIDYFKDGRSDPYWIDDLESILNRHLSVDEKKQYRSYFKAMFMRLINCEDEVGAKFSLQEEVNRENCKARWNGKNLVYPVDLDASKKGRIWDSYKARHLDISKYFADSDERSASYGFLMKLDSDLIVDITMRLLNKRITCLSVHDSIIVPEYAKSVAMSIIKDVFIELLAARNVKPIEPVLEVDSFYTTYIPWSKDVYLGDKDLLQRSYLFSKAGRQSYACFIPS